MLAFLRNLFQDIDNALNIALASRAHNQNNRRGGTRVIELNILPFVEFGYAINQVIIFRAIQKNVIVYVQCTHIRRYFFFPAFKACLQLCLSYPQTPV